MTVSPKQAGLQSQFTKGTVSKKYRVNLAKKHKVPDCGICPQTPGLCNNSLSLQLLFIGWRKLSLLSEEAAFLGLPMLHAPTPVAHQLLSLQPCYVMGHKSTWRPKKVYTSYTTLRTGHKSRANWSLCPSWLGLGCHLRGL